MSKRTEPREKMQQVPKQMLQTSQFMMFVDHLTLAWILTLLLHYVLILFATFNKAH
ncbi:hypothetical protein PGIGA_G00233300, partial [Pangasianodon gigas]|nr:hypothetical protein [Pangasianodon gigas]